MAETPKTLQLLFNLHGLVRFYFIDLCSYFSLLIFIVFLDILSFFSVPQSNSKNSKALFLSLMEKKS